MTASSRSGWTALASRSVPGYDTWAGFLQRRVAPAMRTCRSVEERQANLSRKLTRATTLLRTWVDVEVEKQNRDLLASMNNRARLQLRLQQTVEGLSVAAVSYYVVGLIGYLAKGTLLFGAETRTGTGHRRLCADRGPAGIWWSCGASADRTREGERADRRSSVRRLPSCAAHW